MIYTNTAQCRPSLNKQAQAGLAGWLAGWFSVCARDVRPAGASGSTASRAHGKPGPGQPQTAKVDSLWAAKLAVVGQREREKKSRVIWVGGRDSRSRPIWDVLSEANDRDGDGIWAVDGTRGSGSDASRRSRAVVLNFDRIVSYRNATQRMQDGRGKFTKPIAAARARAVVAATNR